MPFLFLALAILVVALSGCASTSLPTAGTRSVQTDFSARTEVVFTPPAWPVALKADLYQPEGPGPWPAVLLIYGGSWSDADHRWQMRLLARKLARRGYVVMNASYRGTPAFHYPAPVDDLREALRWLRAHAADYRVDPNKIASYGFSAGGHLAAQLGTLSGPPEVRVQAVVAASAPTALFLFPDSPVLQTFLATTYEQNPQVFREASPVTHVSTDDPPVFQYQGTADRTVSPEHSRVFKAALDRAGIRNELLWLEGKAHAAVLIFGGKAEDAAIDFLDAAFR